MRSEEELSLELIRLKNIKKVIHPNSIADYNDAVINTLEWVLNEKGAEDANS